MVQWMGELDYKEGWVPKNWCFWFLVLEKTLESPLDSKEIKSVNPKENQPWIYMGRTEVEVPMLWSPDGKSQLIGKDPDAGKDGRQKEKGAAEDEMVGWHHWFTGHIHEFEQTECCNPWGHKESGETQQLNSNNPRRYGSSQVVSSGISVSGFRV